jgi:hypothetical protein
MIKFFSFCCFINRISKDDLIFGLKLLLSSLDYYVKDYEFILYTNFDINIDNKNLKIRKYYDNSYKDYYNDMWLNLNFNRINIYKDLYDETNENYIWIDLDTIITYDISYLENIDNFFIEHGGNCDIQNHPIIINHFYLNVNRSIQGAVWKININLYNKLIDFFNDTQSKNLKIEYDIQGLFSYYLYYILNGQIDNINIYGLNFYQNTINGLGIWSNNPILNKHCDIEGLDNMYYENNILKTKYYPDKEIHFAMFTFYTLNEFKNSDKFKKLFGHLLNF